MPESSQNPASAATEPPRPGRVLVRAGAVTDGAGVDAAPGCVLLDGATVVAAGPPAEIGSVPDAAVLDRPFAAVIPATVNAHAHLDLSHVDPLPAGDDFTAWIEMIREARHPDDASIARSVRRGIELSLAGGTAAIGDIAGTGSAVPGRELTRSPLGGVSYVEVFGVGARQDDVASRLSVAGAPDGAPLSPDGRLRPGHSPHAPYSCGPAVYRAAAASGLPVATHLAETTDEIDFVRGGGGRFEAFLREIGAWDDSVIAGPQAMGATGRHPIDLVLEAFAAGRDEARAAGREPGPIVAAHVNYPADGHLDALAAAGVAVAYCPRASSYFRHPVAGEAPHAWAAMAAHGITVCLGTDGRPCLDTPDRISVIDEMRFLVRRDRVPARQVLPLGLAAGARALGLDPGRFTLAPGPVAGLLSIPSPAALHGDRLEAAMRTDAAPEWLLDPSFD